MKIGIIGAGQIGRTLTALLVQAGHDVWVANSRGPQSLTGLVGQLGGRRRRLRPEDRMFLSI